MRPSPAYACEQLALWSVNRPQCAEALGQALSEEKWHRRKGGGARRSSWDSTDAIAPSGKQSA